MIKIPKLKTGHKIATGAVAFIFLVAILYGILDRTVIFFRTNTIVKHQILKTEWQWPLEVIKITDLEKRQALERTIEEKSTEWAHFILTGGTEPQVTPNPDDKTIFKGESLIPQIKQVEAKGNRDYTYQNYSKRTHYTAVLEGLKKRYTNWEDAAELEAKEGMFEPGITNPTSGACGLPQALPCQKMLCPLAAKGIDCQLDWMKDYVADRYGTIEKALNFRILNGWY